MVILKFMAWVQQPNRREDPGNSPATRDKVVVVDNYEVHTYPESNSQLVTFRRASSEVSETEILSPPEDSVSCPFFRKLYVMNEQGKTIDSYSAEPRS